MQSAHTQHGVAEYSLSIGTTGFSINVRAEQESTKPYGAAFENNTPSGVTFSDNLRIFAMPAARAVPHTALHRDATPPGTARSRATAGLPGS